MSQNELFYRLRKAMVAISESPETASEVSSLFEEFVVSVEEIALDLSTESDEDVARNVREIVSLSQNAVIYPQDGQSIKIEEPPVL